jgi:hypothetical protein
VGRETGLEVGGDRGAQSGTGIADDEVGYWDGKAAGRSTFEMGWRLDGLPKLLDQVVVGYQMGEEHQGERYQLLSVT